MPAIVVKAFGGLKPIASALLLQSGDATVAENARLVSGALVPLKGMTKLKDSKILTPWTIFRYGKSSSEVEHWLEFAFDTDVVNSPIPDDPYSRVYWTDGGTAKYATSTLALSGTGALPGGSLTLGIPSPNGTPSASQSSYGYASATITASQIDALFIGSVLSIEVDNGSPAVLTLTGSGGDVSATTLASQLNGVTGITATVVNGDVKVETKSSVETSAIKISKKVSDVDDYSTSAITYQDFIGPIYGNNPLGGLAGTLSSPAKYTVSSGMITALPVGTRLAVTVNSNPDVLVTASAGTGTFPESVTPTSFKTAVNVLGLNVTLNDGTDPSVTIETAATGSAASFRIRKVVPGKKATYSELASGSNVAAASDTETRSYVYTYVSEFGEEGPPSKPSSLVTVNPNVSVTVANLDLAPSGAYSITKKRIYRTSTVGTTAQFQFVDEIPVATTSYADSKSQSDLGEVLLSTDWSPPPAGLRGLKMMANGVAVGFVGNTLYMSEPNMPHAWPHKYPVDYQIVGLSPFRQSVAILTTGHPFLASGVDPAGMSLERLEFPHACLSKQSIVDTGDGCLYAGADGIVSIGAGGMKLVSEQLFSREQWQTYNPSTMRAYFHDNRYHVLYQDVSNVRGTMIFDFSGQGALLTTATINTATPISAGYSDPRTDTLYFAQSGEIRRYNSATTSLTSRWKTGTYRLIKPVNFSFGMVRAKSYPVTLKITPDNRPTFVKTVANDQAFRLPAGFLAQQWQFEIECNDEVSMFAVATSATELQGIQ
jgi:hypothetical protein